MDITELDKNFAAAKVGKDGKKRFSYEELICERTGVDYINLGFSGNGKAEDNMVDYLRGIDCSVFVCDYDHNAPTP